MAGYTEQETYPRPVPARDAVRRTGVQPQGQGIAGAGGYLDRLPAPTGYYPELYASGEQQAVHGEPVYSDQYRDTIPYTPQLARAERVDQHAVLHVSQTWTPPREDARPDGRSDPAAAGPPRPDLDDVSMHYYRERGATGTRLLDVPGRRFASNGVQDEVSWTWATSSRLQLADYDPAQLDPATGQMPDSLLAIPPAGARGWSAQPPVVSQQELIDKAAALTQQQPARQDLIANSTYAGQSFGMRTRHVGGPAARVATSVRGGAGNGRG